MSALALALAGWLAAAPAPNPWLEQAKEDFRALDYEKCLKRLDQAAKAASPSRGEQSAIELYQGLCTFHLGDEKSARSHFTMALRLDESADLPSFTSPRAVDLFRDVKVHLRAPAAPFPADDLPPDAPRDASLFPAPRATEPAPIAWKRYAGPIGAGVVAVAATGVAIGLGLQASSLARDANAARYESDFRALGDSAKANALGANVAWGVAAVALVTGAALLVTAPPAASAPVGDDASR